MTHICVSKQTIIGSDNGLSPGRRQAIIWTNAGILLIGTLGTNFSEILIDIRIFSFKKMSLNVSSAKWRPFYLGLNVLRLYSEDVGRLLSVEWQVLQAVSVIVADNMIRVAIRRALGYRHGYSHKTWIFRFPRCSVAANNAIRTGHCAPGAIHNIHSCANSVMEGTIPLLRFLRAWRL